MAAGDLAQLGGGFGQGDIEAPLSGAGALQQELQSDGGLAAAGRALQQIGAVLGQAAAKDVVEIADAGGNPGDGVGFGVRLHPSTRVWALLKRLDW